MKIKITGSGWQGFTGYLGSTHFTDGVSTSDVGDIEARRLAAVVAIETMDGHNPSAAQQIIDSRSTSLVMATTINEPAAEAPAGPEMTYTYVELEEIADKGGIKALRDIADIYGVKGNSIIKLIEGLVALRKPEVQAEEPSAEEPAAAESTPAAE